MNVVIKIGNCREYIPEADALGIAYFGDTGQFPLSKWYQLYEVSPESFLFAVDEDSDKLLGYIIMVPVNDEFFEKTKQVNFTEELFSPEHVRSFRKGTNYVYFFSILISKKCDERIRVLRMMAKAEVEFCKKLALDGKYITQATALAYTQAGEKLCSGLKMTEVGKNECGTVYHGEKFYRMYKKEDTHDQILKTFTVNRKGNN